MNESKFRQKINSLARYIEQPSFMNLRRKKVNVEIYEALDQRWLRDLNIRTVLDIGSNTGHFAFAINALMPSANIYSFEPLPECFEELATRAKNTPNMKVFNLALGNQSGSLEFKRSSSNLSSSFLEMTDLHKTAFPETADSETTVVKIERLDDVYQKLDIQEPILLKIDVQGFEDQVIAGGMDVVNKATVIIIETSFCKLYEKQPLFDDIYSILLSHNYCYAGALETLKDPNTGRILQEDSIFISSRHV